MNILGTDIKTLEDLFILRLQYLYDVESELVSALPDMAALATDPDLQEGLKSHLEETKGHTKRLEQAFAMLDSKPKKAKSATIRALVDDGKSVFSQKPSPELLDAAIVSAARAVEHFEMAEYLSAIAWAEALGHTGAVELLESTLEEERNADMKLNDVNQTIIERAQETVIGDEDEDEE